MCRPQRYHWIISESRIWTHRRPSVLGHMGRRVDIDDLVAAQQIAERLGLAYVQTVYNWIDRYPDFPAPAWTHGRIRLWLWPEVAAWARETGRLRR